MTRDNSGSNASAIHTPERSRNLEGALWLFASGLTFTVFLTLAKFMSSTEHPAVLAFWRSFVALLVTLPVLFHFGLGYLKSDKPFLLIARSLLGTGAFLCSMYAISDAFTLPLSQFNAISFSRAMFVTILAALLLREAVGTWRWGAVLAGFLGVVVMVLPGYVLPGFASDAIIVDGGTWLALVSAAGFAGAIVLVKSLTATHSPMSLLIWANLMSSVLLAPFVFWFGGWPGYSGAGLLIAMALAGTAGQYFYITAMSVGDASFLAPIDYLRLPMAALADLLVFQLFPGLNVWLGAAIIVSATLLITWRESRQRRVQKS
ncbi:MAG: DMT family transporter [Pseudomonadota bacterium]